MRRSPIYSLGIALIILLCVYKGLLYCTAFAVIHSRNSWTVSYLDETRDTPDSKKNLYFEILKKNIWAAKDNTRQQIVCDGIILLAIIVSRCIYLVKK